ncbi:hypothetical protein AWW72_14885 [Acinetobacter sp. NRRL B-65365]|uniref:hypothetical protein n=1 Tax=Acinetobacter sp. NRRL B-65365 TaxID=1785092 RepID=UPI0007A080F3|nr:hypothetical protein [Acinetobacter sp. NRRL B-65365]KYQ83280.1 hypothetical protein AWW72_14885 [Acinetobacter sp. NRRL B-65365]
MDWNVFFSTISQTAGAIVGIFSAFLITKIVSNQTTYSQKQDQAADCIAKSKKLVNESSIRYFHWYGERKADEAIGKISDDYSETKVIQTAEYYFDIAKFSPFESRSDSLAIIQKEIAKIEELKRIEDERIMSSKNSISSGFSYLTPVYTQMPRIINQGLGTQLLEERDLIDDLFVRIQYQADVNNNLHKDLENNTESSTLISISILAMILLFFTGVIYPLSFLPMLSGSEISLTISAFWDLLFSLKGALLVVISVIFGGLMIVFLHANYKLKYSQELKDELKKYSDPRNYSSYFKNYVDNSAVESE